MTKTWFSTRQGIEYKVVGLIEQNSTHEVYLVQNKNYGKTQIIHVLSNGNGQRYKTRLLTPDKIELLTEVAKRKKPVLIPWTYDENAIDRENGLDTNYASEV